MRPLFDQAQASEILTLMNHVHIISWITKSLVPLQFSQQM